MNNIQRIIHHDNVEALMRETLANVYMNGPTSISDMETLSYIKLFDRDLFERYQETILLTIGTFYKTINNQDHSFADHILLQYRESIRELFNKSYTPIQADIVKSVEENQVFSFSAPTSTGKSYVFLDLIKQSKHDVVIVVPSRALINEYYQKLNRAIPDKEINLLTFIDKINIDIATKNIFIVTPERCRSLFQWKDTFNVELFLFDEAQLTDEKSVRGLYYDSVVRRCKECFPAARIVFAQPFVQNPEAQISKNHLDGMKVKAKRYPFKNVGQIFLLQPRGSDLFYYFGIDKSEMGNEKILCTTDPINAALNTGGSVLIYLSKRRVVNYTFLNDYGKYVEMCPEIVSEKVDNYILQLKDYTGGDTIANKNYYSQFISLLKRGIVIHHGSMPLQTRSIVEEYVKDGFCRLCFATSTLEQGINMPFDIVCLDRFEESKPLAIKNLIGRAGRSTSGGSFDFGYVIVRSSTNMSSLRKILLENDLIDSESTLDRHDDLDAEYGDFKKAILDGTIDDRFSLSPNQISRLEEVAPTRCIRRILDMAFSNQGTLVESQSFNAQLYISNMQSIYEYHLSRQLGPGEKNVFETALRILIWRLYHATFKQICRYRYIVASKVKERRQLESRGFRTDKLLCAYVTGYEDLPNRDLPKYPLIEKNTRAKDVSYDQIMYDTYDYVDKLIDFKLGDIFFAAFMKYGEDTGDDRAIKMANLLRYGSYVPRYMWMVRYGMDYESIEKLDDHIERIDEHGIVFKESINNVSDDEKRVVARFIR